MVHPRGVTEFPNHQPLVPVAASRGGGLSLAGGEEGEAALVDGGGAGGKLF